MTAPTTSEARRGTPLSLKRLEATRLPWAPRTAGDDDLDVDLAVGAGGRADDAGDGLRVVADGPGDEVGVGVGALGAAGGEEEDGFEQVGLALGVGAEEEYGAGGEVELEAGVVAEVGELEAAEVHVGG